MARSLKTKDVLQIDKYNLDKMIVEQPAMFVVAAEEKAEAAKQLELAKNRREVCEADITKELRTNPAKFGLDANERITEKVIKHICLTDSQWSEFNLEVIEWQYEVDMLDGLVKALSQRKDMLQDAIRLFLAGYFAEPKVPEREVQEYIDNSNKRRVRRSIPKS